MKPRRGSLLALAYLLTQALSPSAFAASGEEGFRFLNVPLSPRSQAMAGASTAVADDAGAAASNPAAWGELRRGEVFLANDRMAEGAGLSGASVAWPATVGTWGLDVRTQGYGDIPGYDAGDQATGSVDARDTAVGLAYGRPWGRRWTVGAALRQAQQKVADVSGQTVAADAGVLWRPAPWGRTRGLRLGAALRNVGPGASLGSQKTSLPRTFSLGAAYQTFADGWITAVDLEKAGGGKPSWRIGQEVWLGSLALRAGCVRRDGFSSGYSMGAGFRVRDIQVDYAFEAQGKGYQDAHRLGLTWRFGGSVEALYAEGVRLLQAGRTGEAILKFNEVLEVKPDHRRAVERLREAADILRKEKESGDEAK